VKKVAYSFLAVRRTRITNTLHEYPISQASLTPATT
jgi:hypothetical protein